MRVLERVRCSFKYADLPARLLVAAKRHGSRDARLLLEACFVQPAIESIVRQIQFEPPQAVFLAPLAFRRWWSLAWHPLESVQAGLLDAARCGRIPARLPIHWRSEWRWSRQSVRSGAERREGLLASGLDVAESARPPLLEEQLTAEAPRLLLVDDVLTSGETLLRLARKHAASGMRMEAYAVFRTCMSDAIGSGAEARTPAACVAPPGCLGRA